MDILEDILMICQQNGLEKKFIRNMTKVTNNDLKTCNGFS